MSACTYDNPSTCRRECWQDGREICSYAMEVLQPFARNPVPASYYFFGANIGPWKAGQMVGNPGAIARATGQSHD